MERDNCSCWKMSGLRAVSMARRPWLLARASLMSFCSRSSRTTLVRPCDAATCSGVLPSLSRALGVQLARALGQHVLDHGELGALDGQVEDGGVLEGAAGGGTGSADRRGANSRPNRPQWRPRRTSRGSSWI